MSDLAMFSVDDDDFVVFGFENASRIVSGPEAALQIAAYALFTVRGSNAFARNEGGGLLRAVGDVVRTVAEIRADAAVSVRQAMDMINDTQSDDKDANETIIDLVLVDARVRGTTIELDIRIDLADGNSFSAKFRV